MAQVPALAKHLEQQRVQGAFVCGTTGEGESARRWQELARTMLEIVNQAGGLNANKVLMSMVTGIDCGPVRMPLQNLTRLEIDALRARLEAAGIFEGLAEADQLYPSERSRRCPARPVSAAGCAPPYPWGVLARYTSSNARTVPGSGASWLGPIPTRFRMRRAET